MNTAECYICESINSYSRIMLRLLLEKPGRSASEIIETAAELLADEFLQDKKGRILTLAVAESMEHKEREKILSDIDIETLQASDALLLALARQRYEVADFGADIEPRLKGLIQYQRFANLKQQAVFSETAGLLNRAGIVPMISHDSAMKYYRPDGLRYFDSVEFVALSLEDFGAIRSVLSKAGYAFEDNAYAFDASRDDSAGGLKIRVLNADAMRKDVPELLLRTIAERGGIKEPGGAYCYVPSPEDTVLLTANRIWMKLKNSNNFPGVAFDIMDLHYMIRVYGASQDIIINRVSSSKVHLCEYCFTAKFVNRIFERLIPLELSAEKKSESVFDGFVCAERKRLNNMYSLRSSLTRVARRFLKRL